MMPLSSRSRMPLPPPARAAVLPQSLSGWLIAEMPSARQGRMRKLAGTVCEQKAINMQSAALLRSVMTKI